MLSSMMSVRSKESHKSSPSSHRARIADVSSSSSSRESTADFVAQFKAANVSPFKIRWINGFNHKSGVINLNCYGSTLVFYAAANCGIIYNWTMHQMRILQGHKHMVTCVAADEKGDWLVTADSGPENILIVWDRQDLLPYRTIFSPHDKDNLAKVAMSADAKYLLTMAYGTNALQLRWWIWSFNLPNPHASIELVAEKSSIDDMSCNPYCTEEFCLMTKNCIWVGKAQKIKVIEREVLKETDNWEIKLTSPALKKNLEYGKYTCFTFVQKTRQIVVGTSRGVVIFYGYTLEYKSDSDQTPETRDIETMRFIKMLKIENKRINAIKSIDNIIATANNVGHMHFYDDQFKLLYWIHGFPINCIKAVSFNISPRSYKLFDTKCKKLCICWEQVVCKKDKNGVVQQKLHLMQVPADASTSGKPVIIRDFLLITMDQGVVFVDFITEKLKTVVDNKPANVMSMTVHPIMHTVCLGYANGTVELFDFMKHRIIMKANLRQLFTTVIPAVEDSITSKAVKIVPQLIVTCLQFSPSGLHLACGFSTGELVFLHPSSLDLITPVPFRDTKHSIKLITYSSDSTTMALADSGKTICVYKYDCNKFVWMFIGKHRSHCKDVVSLLFLPEKNERGTDFNLLSIGKDRLLVEYDISASSDEYLEIMSLDRIEQSGTPLGAILWPAPPDLDPDMHRVDLPLLLMTNDEYKYKVVNYATTMTLSTILGPRYETAVCKMQLVNKIENETLLQYLLFATKDVIGLQKLPLDGNPWKHVGMLGHPNKILQMDYREDLDMVFIIGDKDTTLMQWAVTFRSVEISTKSGGVDLDPYYCLIENMRPGWLFQEIRDLFYYIQILCQGTFSPAMRRVKDYIPIDSLPDLMRALGFFPTEYAVENLLVEARFKVYLRQPITEIDFEDFVKLYLNHRPALGEKFKKVSFAFRNFANMNQTDYSMPRDEFINMLTSNGECFTRELAWYLLSILSGHSFEDRALMTEDDFSFLPEEITFSDFVNNIIGMQEIEDLSETYSHLGSMLSRVTLTSEMSDEKMYDDFELTDYF